MHYPWNSAKLISERVFFCKINFYILRCPRSLATVTILFLEEVHNSVFNLTKNRLHSDHKTFRIKVEKESKTRVRTWVSFSVFNDMWVCTPALSPAWLLKSDQANPRSSGERAKENQFWPDWFGRGGKALFWPDWPGGENACAECIFKATCVETLRLKGQLKGSQNNRRLIHVAKQNHFWPD